MAEQENTTTETNDGGGTGGYDCNEARISELLVSSFESSVRATYCMIRMPIAMYASLLESWSKAVEAALRECEPPDPGPRPPHNYRDLQVPPTHTEVNRRR